MATGSTAVAHPGLVYGSCSRPASRLDSFTLSTSSTLRSRRLSIPRLHSGIFFWPRYWLLLLARRSKRHLLTCPQVQLSNHNELPG